MRNVYSNLYKKYVRPHRTDAAGPWRWFFNTSTVLQSAYSAGSLTFDRLRFALKQCDIELLYTQREAVNFDITCINLLRRADKRKFIKKQLSRAGLDFKIFPAIDGLILDHHRLVDDGILAPDNYCPATSKPLTSAQIGVYLSHYELWKAALRSPNKISLILEDDALFTCDKPTLQEYARHIPADTDLFFINHRKNKIKHVTLHASKFACHFWGLTAYFLTKQGAEKLIAMSLPIHKSADESISELNEIGKLNCYCSRQELVVECSNPKDAKNFRFSSDIISRVQK
ncbi:MAG: glycosyltransferase family 25 protein [Nitrosomonas sp.]|nr:MAG: glycosyltransferase family 25 protein [Nitrosomonas sp.]